jgi:ribosome maturation factor RimP
MRPAARVSPDSTLVVGMSRAAEIRGAVVELLQPLLAVEGLVLVECTVALDRGGLRLDLAVDRDDSPADGVHGLTVGEYSRLTRYLENLLGAEMPELGGFRLTVGSPGVTRRLESELELEWGVGKRVEVRVKRRGGKLLGRLVGFDGQSVTVEVPEDGLRRVERNEIAGLRLYFPFPGAEGKRRKRR